MKKWLIMCLLSAVCLTQTAFAANPTGNTLLGRVPEGAPVVVTDLGIHEGAATSDIAILHVGKTGASYVMERLVDSGRFNVIEHEAAEAALLGGQSLSTLTADNSYYAPVYKKLLFDEQDLAGLIDPDTAMHIGEIFGVKYLIYGNVNDVSISGVQTTVLGSGVAVGTTKAHVILRMMDVATGEIVMASKGEGKSKTSYVKAGAPTVGYITIGTHKVTQDSVHNAVQKAAYQAVDIMVERLYGGKGKKAKKSTEEE